LIAKLSADLYRFVGAITARARTIAAALPWGLGQAGPTTSASESIRRHILAGSILVGVLVIGLGGWASTAQISGALIAPGSIVVDTNVKKVQHPTGGVVGEVRAHDGDRVKAGEVIATMGRTSNAETILKERAHVHFELNLLVNDNFAAWFKKTSPHERNDHGEWNGQNLNGLDPREILLAERNPAKPFDLPGFIRGQTELCRVLVRATNFPYLRRYPMLVLKNPTAAREGIAGYEVALNYNGVAFALMPRAASEIKSPARIQLVSVNETEARANPCRHLVVKRGSRWQLGNEGSRAVELLTF